jgi:hypothetical protein
VPSTDQSHWLCLSTDPLESEEEGGDGEASR